MTNSIYDDVYEGFKLQAPLLEKRAVKWCVIDNLEILVELDEGDVVSYDHIYGYCRWAKSKEEWYGLRRPDTEMKWRKQFGLRLERRMKEKGYSQEDLAYATDISQSTISKYTWGHQTPNAWAIAKIAKVLRCSSDELLYFD